jgi:hypothetical protein
MKLFYAMGGGMGHLCRVSLFIQQFRIADYKILTANPLANTFFDAQNILFLPPETYPSAVANFFEIDFPKLRVSDLYIDTFPSGLLGEVPFDELGAVKVHYLARRLIWEKYRHLANEKCRFSTTYQMEPLEEEHGQFLASRTDKLIQLALDYSGPDARRIPAHQIPNKRPIWLVVHTFKKEEVEALLHYAEEVAALHHVFPFFVVLSDQAIEVNNGVCFSYFPAMDWFPLADRIFTGAGFNTVQQIKPFLSKSTIIPFPRQYDDQVWRAATIGKPGKQ